MKIYIIRRPATLMNELYFVDEPRNNLSKGAIITFINIKENGEAILTRKVHEIEMTLDTPPTMVLPEDQTRELIQAFMQLGKEQGIRPLTESEAVGRLQAQTVHLQDLRKLLKL